MNAVSAALLVALSVVLLVDIATGIDQPPLPDEGVQAHVFQLAVAAMVPVIGLYLATRDWTRPLRGVWPLVLAAIALVVSFAGVYHIEHH